MAMKCVKTGCYFRFADMAPCTVMSGDMFWDPDTNEVVVCGCSDVFQLVNPALVDVKFNRGRMEISCECINYINEPKFDGAYVARDLKLVVVTHDRFSFVEKWLRHR